MFVSNKPSEGKEIDDSVCFAALGQHLVLATRNALTVIVHLFSLAAPSPQIASIFAKVIPRFSCEALKRHSAFSASLKLEKFNCQIRLKRVLALASGMAESDLET